MSDCQRLGKMIGGCRFEPRYDVGAPAIWEGGVKFSIPPYEDMATILDVFRPRTYVHDVCMRCGKTVKREPQNGGDKK